MIGSEREDEGRMGRREGANSRRRTREEENMGGGEELAVAALIIRVVPSPGSLIISEENFKIITRNQNFLLKS